MCMFFLFRALWNFVIFPLALFHLAKNLWESVLKGHWHDAGLTVLCLIPLCRSRSIAVQVVALFWYRHFVLVNVH